MAAAGCQPKNGTADLSKERQRQYVLNSQLFSKGLGRLVLDDHDSLSTDSLLRSYYADSTSTRLWVDRLAPTAGADSLLALLERKARRAGFSPSLMGLTQMRQQLDSLNRVDQDSLRPEHLEWLAQLEYGLTKNYLRFARGLRYGFVEHPEKVLNSTGMNSLQHIATPPRAFGRKALGEASRGNAVAFLSEGGCEDTLYLKMEAQLASATDAAVRKRLIANMERCRWHHSNRPNADEKYVLVNVAAQQLWAVSADTVLQMRIVCGARGSRTPLMKGMLSTIVVNPYWYIPAKVVRDEIGPHGGDAAYFRRHHYFITDGNNDTIPPEKVTREQLQANRYRVTQHRGAGNALGRLKFNFHNPFSVYLHDTNTPGAFKRADRALSHGCVRVQRPFDLALFLLGLDPDDEDDAKTIDRMRVAIGMQPLTDEERQWLEEHGDDREAVLNRSGNRYIRPHVPVYIIYYTLYPNPEDGRLQTWGDPYGYDTLLLKAMNHYVQL